MLLYGCANVAAAWPGGGLEDVRGVDSLVDDRIGGGGHGDSGERMLSARAACGTWRSHAFGSTGTHGHHCARRFCVDRAARLCTAPAGGRTVRTGGAAKYTVTELETGRVRRRGSIHPRRPNGRGVALMDPATVKIPRLPSLQAAHQSEDGRIVVLVFGECDCACNINPLPVIARW